MKKHKRGHMSVLSEIMHWVLSSILTLFIFAACITLSLPTFLNSHFAHCALLYILSKNLANVLESMVGVRHNRYKWLNAKARILITTVSVVNELFLLYLRYPDRTASSAMELTVLAFVGLGYLVFHKSV